MGRKPKLAPQQMAHARKLLEQGERPAHIAQLLKVSWRTVERALTASHNKSKGCTGDTGVAKLISFDIDGTLEVGDPPGIITLHMVRQAKHLGYLIGSCSDRTISYQQRLWYQHEITVDFTVLKHQLADIKARFQAEAYYHIGDTDMDRFFADQAGFHFCLADATAHQLWSPEVFL